MSNLIFFCNKAGISWHIKFSEVGGPTMVGSDVKKIFEMIPCTRAKKHLPD